MRTRTLKRNVQKQVKKEAEKSIKTLINEFHTKEKKLIFGDVLAVISIIVVAYLWAIIE